MTATKTPKKEEVKVAPTDDTAKAVQKGAEKVAQVADEVFAKLKTHFEKEKVDAWQKKWLAVPENRKKYEKWIDAPVVVGEEAMAITNDIIDFIQGEEAGQSSIFKKLKGSFQAFMKHPVQSVQSGVNSAKATAQSVQKSATVVKEEVKKAKPPVKKTPTKKSPSVKAIKKAPKPAKK